jgi:hypothetical protein
LENPRADQASAFPGKKNNAEETEETQRPRRVGRHNRGIEEGSLAMLGMTGVH